MKIRLHLIFDEGRQMISDFDIPKKDLDKLGLFGAIEKKTKSFQPKKILIL